MLSNTATPIYYGQFREKVMQGKIPVCKEISMEMNRIDELIANPGVYYDDEAINGFIEFCESEMTLTDGSDLYMLDSFKLWAEQVFGWYYFVDRSVYVPTQGDRGGHYERRRIKKRLINKQFIILGRGGAKSLYDSCVQAYWLCVDTSTTEQIVVAPTMRQSEETLTPIKTAIARSRGPLFKFLTLGSLQNTTGIRANRVKLTPTKKGIENFFTNSIIEVRPMRIDKLQGARCKVATMDEWLSGDIREDPILAIEQSASKNSDYLIVATSSEGTVRNGVGDAIKMELMSILRGEYKNPHVSIWYYRLDDIKEVGQPEMWLKANPNLGVTVTYETYQLEVEKAENNPATRNETLAKRFGIPLEGFTYFFTYQQTIPHVPVRDYWQMSCSMGMDASQGDDFFSIAFLFPLANGEFGVKTRNYISSKTLYGLPGPQRTKYDEFIDEGSLFVLEGDIIDAMEVYEDIEQLIDDREYDVCCFGYDPYNAKEFVERWCQLNGPFGVEKVPQGARTESVPLGEIRNLAEMRKLIFDEKLVQYTMGNCITIEDTNGNRKLLKKRYENKIDAVAAIMDAFVAYKLHKEVFM